MKMAVLRGLFSIALFDPPLKSPRNIPTLLSPPTPPIAEAHCTAPQVIKSFQSVVLIMTCGKPSHLFLLSGCPWNVSLASQSCMFFNFCSSLLMTGQIKVIKVKPLKMSVIAQGMFFLFVCLFYTLGTLLSISALLFNSC